MANLYFCQPHANNQGMLRAVLTSAECKQLVSALPAEYIGSQFPAPEGHNGTGDYAVLSVNTNEADPQCRSGFYRLAIDLDKVNAVLLALAK